MIDLNDRLIRMDPVALPASPEFLNDAAEDFGRRALRQIAEIADGGEVLDVRSLFERRSTTVARRPVVYPLLAFVIAMLLLDVADQRFAMAARLRRHLELRWRNFTAAAATGTAGTSADAETDARATGTRAADSGLLTGIKKASAGITRKKPPTSSRAGAGDITRPKPPEIDGEKRESPRRKRTILLAPGETPLQPAPQKTMRSLRP